MSRIKDSVEGLNHQELFVIKLTLYNTDETISIAVTSKIERDRILRFLNVWINWYQLYAQDLASMDSNDLAQPKKLLPEEDTPIKKYRRSLEQYLDTVEPFAATLTNPYNSLSDSCSTPHSTTMSPSNSMSGSFPQTKSGKRGFDFSMVNADAVDQLKHNQVLSKSTATPPNSLTPVLNYSTPQDSIIQLQSLIPYPYHDNIPKILQVLVYYLYKLDAYSNEGIFRISSLESSRQQLKNDLTDGCYAAILDVNSGFLIASRSVRSE